MKRLSLLCCLACLLAAPPFPQAMEVTCGDYSALNNAQQIEIIAAVGSETSRMATEQQLSADAIHEKLVAECKDQSTSSSLS